MTRQGGSHSELGGRRSRVLEAKRRRSIREINEKKEETKQQQVVARQRDKLYYSQLSFNSECLSN